MTTDPRKYACGFLLAATFITSTVAARMAQQTTALPAGTCTALQGLEISASAIGLPTGGAIVQAAAQVSASEDKNNTASTAVFEFEVNLPSAWNGRALQLGGGGLDGSLITGLLPYRQQPPGTETALKQGYVTLGSNGGHRAAAGPDALFGLDDEALANTADDFITPYNSIAYYRRQVAQFGQRTLDTFLRFYLIPGFAHGYGAFDARFDALNVLQNWVERGQAPSGLTAMDGNPNSNRSRPLCEYPKWPKFAGAPGTESLASSFACVTN